jgi:hypothetical protein
MTGVEREGSVKKIQASLKEKIAAQIKEKGVSSHVRSRKRS